MLRRATIRLASTIAPRAFATMLGAGSLIGYESSFVDLRYSLPVREGTEYAQRREDQISGLVFHHSATTGQTIRSMAEFHTETKKWPGIAYHYAIGHDGRVYILHDATTISFHTQNHNRGTIGVVLVGNYHAREMTQEMKESAVLLAEYLKDRYRLRHMWLHRDTKATACPGRYAEDFLRNIQWGPLPAL